MEVSDGSSIDNNGRWHSDGNPEELPLITGESAAEIFNAQHQHVLGLFEPLWDYQYAAIRADFAQVLVGKYGEGDAIEEQSPRDDSNANNTPLSQVMAQPAASPQSPIREWRPRLPETTSDVGAGSRPGASWRTRERARTFSQAPHGSDLPQDFFRNNQRRSSAADSSSWWRST